MVGRFLVALCAGLVAFVFVTGLGSADALTAGCAHPCGGGSSAITQTQRPTPDPCIRDVGCGGGAALGSGIAVAAVMLVAAGASALGLREWRRWRAVSRPQLGRQLSGGLFRPPRILFDA